MQMWVLLNAFWGKRERGRWIKENINIHVRLMYRKSRNWVYSLECACVHMTINIKEREKIKVKFWLMLKWHIFLPTSFLQY